MVEGKSASGNMRVSACVTKHILQSGPELKWEGITRLHGKHCSEGSRPTAKLQGAVPTGVIPHFRYQLQVQGVPQTTLNRRTCENCYTHSNGLLQGKGAD